jgi:hypothetical protein
MKMKSRKGLLTLLALVLVFSLTVTAYAAWPSFQNDADNNGCYPRFPSTADSFTDRCPQIS